MADTQSHVLVETVNMPNAIRTLDGQNLTIGTVALGRDRDKPGTVESEVHDGDTIVASVPGNIGIRFLGIDTPEVSYRFPGTSQFIDLSDARWNEFLQDPVADRWPAFSRRLDEGLLRSLESRARPDAGSNHALHAARATEFLKGEVARDVAALSQTEETFRFFLAFGHEMMDGYGRFLAYVNREQPDRNRPSPRPLTYNERMLQSGMSLPYFIWPNVNPFKKASSVIAAVIPAGGAQKVAEADQTLRQSRAWVKAARSEHRGVFDAMQPLVFEAFELRMLAGRQPPHRWVIDLSRNDDVLLQPQNYHTIPWPEDRLFIPEEYVPLFTSKGWKLQE